MLVNNPVYTMRLIDLIDTNKVPFEYSNIYITVNDWLTDLKQSFYTSDSKQWDIFIERFCDRYYSRNINFDSYLEFKIKLKSLMDSKKMIVDRYVILNAKNINPFSTYGVEKKSKGNKSTEVANDSTSRTNGKTESNYTDKNYSLHSDTPASTVNVKDIANGNTNYVTDANNSGGSSKNNNTNSSTSESFGNTHGTEMNIYDEISDGYQGNPIEILDKIDKLTTDVIEKYLLWIEEEHLFSSVFY